MSDFPCTGCGECCKKILGRLVEIGFAEEGGQCKHLQEDNSCGIYDSRPDECRMDKVKIAWGASHLSDEEWNKKRADICNRIQVEQDIDESYRVEL